MDRLLQVILIVCAVLFAAYIINMVRLKKLELNYTLIWIFASFSFIVLAVFPGIIDRLSILLYIKDAVNTLFLIIIFFLILIILSLTAAVSDKSRSLTKLTQEIGLMKFQIDGLVKEINTKSPEEVK